MKKPQAAVRHEHLLRMLYAALCLALCMVLPMITGGIPQIGKYLCPMHLPVLLCGVLCGWPYGVLVGVSAPLLRSLLFGMPVLFPGAVGMSVELLGYGLVAALLLSLLPDRAWSLYPALIGAMLAGRLLGGVMKVLLLTFGAIKSYGMSVYLTSYFVETLPGVVLQLLLIPPICLALRHAGLVPPRR